MVDIDQTPLTLTPADEALITAYKVLGYFITDHTSGYGWPTAIAETDPKAFAIAQDALATIEQALPVAVLLTILPTYTKVTYTINGGTVSGQLREGAWGLCFDTRSRVFPRRITTTMGFETWIGPDAIVEGFTITERGQ